ncbi:MAG: TolC family protein [Verrucomicrobiae bacterium]|nr:TolC family protein [Verrucomicrobiae bacterium]
MSHRLIWCLGTLLVLLALRPAWGETIDLSGTPERVRRSNPDLKAARLAIEEARGRLLGSGRLANPTLNVEFQGESGLSPGSTGIGFDQAFPLTKRLQLEKRLSAQMVEAAELEVRDVERRLISEAQGFVVRLLALEQQRSLRERQAALAKELADFAKERSAKGELSPLDAAQALVDAQQALLGGRTLETERVTVTGALKQLLGVSAETPLTVSGNLPDLEVPVGTNFDRRPDLQGARLKEEAAKTGVDLARTRKWDDLDAGLFAAREREGRPDGERDHSGYVGVRFSLPLPFWNQNEGEVAEKTAGVERAALETEALASAIANEAATARDEMQAHLSLAGEMRETLLPAVREQADRLKTAYERGETDLLSVLRSREQQLRLEAASLDAERDFHLARIRYEAALGVHVPAASPSGK